MLVTVFSSLLMSLHNKRRMKIQVFDIIRVMEYKADRQNITSVRDTENGRPQSKQSNHKKASSLQHSANHGLQSKNNEGTTAKCTKDDQNRIELLSWFEMGEELVAIAKLESKDPNVKVHHVPLGHECWKVWVLDVFEDIALYRPTREFGTLSMAQGRTIAWPIKYNRQV
ncbi:uncharacterized protein LOC112180731 [Rosa chinensis]|uniref:uncharacterized protein LOC112180731 n=1 Tax=Rosa chinensis TaxID=74649 RepID=UPI001AD89F86|nr:uncharacterized protein LOC112180731 [Rosa chinensis]